jgi:low affinity Fe/Cu permease
VRHPKQGDVVAGHSETGLTHLFRALADITAWAVGTPLAFVLAASLLGGWIIAGFFLGFDSVWLLIITTITNLVMFLMVFLLQHSQNRDTKAIHLKLDELLRVTRDARTGLIGVEALSDEELAVLETQFERIRPPVSVSSLGSPDRKDIQGEHTR